MKRETPGYWNLSPAPYSPFNNPSPCQPGFMTIGCACVHCADYRKAKVRMPTIDTDAWEPPCESDPLTQFSIETCDYVDGD